jgi:hypothetical protein
MKFCSELMYYSHYYNDIYLVRPPRGGWLHRSTGLRLRRACTPDISNSHLQLFLSPLHSFPRLSPSSTRLPHSPLPVQQHITHLIVSSNPVAPSRRALSQLVELLKGKVQERKAQERRRPPGLQSTRLIPVPKRRAELEACDQWAVQGKRIHVWHKVTLPKPES